MANDAVSLINHKIYEVFGLMRSYTNHSVNQSINHQSLCQTVTQSFNYLITEGSFQEFRDIGQNYFFCYKSFISCGKSESKKIIS